MKIFSTLLTGLKYVLILALVVSVGYVLLQPRWPSGIQIATGTESGVYNELGESLSRQLSSYPELSEVQINTKRTSGAIENENLLIAKQVDAAFLQGDKQLHKDVKLIARLYTEKLHIIVNQPEIKSIQDLRGRVIGVWSEPESGTDRLLKRVLAGSGMNHQKITTLKDTILNPTQCYLFYEKDRGENNVMQPPRDIAQEFAAHNIAAVVAVSGDGSPYVSSRFTDSRLNADNRFLEILPAEDSDILRAERIYETTIPQGIYRRGAQSYPERPIKTLGADALLAVNSDVSDAVAYYIAKALFDPSFHPPANLTLFQKADQQKINQNDFHPGARAYREGEKPPISFEFSLREFAVPIILIVLLFAPKLLLICMNLDIPFIKEAGPIFYGSILGRFIIADTMRKAASKDMSLMLMRKEYMELPILLNGHTYHRFHEFKGALDKRLHDFNIIRGEGGTGKTTLLLHIFDSLAAELNPKKTLPFLLISPGFTGSVASALVASMKRYGAYINEQTLPSILYQWKSVIFIDGVDGIPTQARDKFINELTELSSMYPELRIILSIREEPLLPGEPLLIETQLLDHDLAQSLFHSLCDAEGIETIEVPMDVLDILDRPLMVKLLVEILRDSHQMPESRLDLLNRYARVVLRESAFGMDYDTCEKILRKLVIILLFEKNRSRFTLDMAEDILAPVISNLESRRGSLTTPYKFLKNAIAAGIIKQEDQALRFFHDSIMYYFAALELKELETSNPTDLRRYRSSRRAAEAFVIMNDIAAH